MKTSRVESDDSLSYSTSIIPRVASLILFSEPAIQIHKHDVVAVHRMVISIGAIRPAVHHLICMRKILCELIQLRDLRRGQSLESPSRYIGISIVRVVPVRCLPQAISSTGTR